MKHTNPSACLSCELLKFIRDNKPTVREFTSWLGSDAEIGKYHLLRKKKFLLIEDDRVVLSPIHLAEDELTFVDGRYYYRIDDDVIMHICGILSVKDS